MGKLEEIIAKLSAYMSRMEEKAKEQYNFKDLTLTQMHYLEMINELENPNLTELAVAMKLTKPTITVLVDKLIEKDFTLIVISNELGMGVISESESTRKFIELQGWINQYIAKSASEAYLMVSGIPLKIK